MPSTRDEKWHDRGSPTHHTPEHLAFSYKLGKGDELIQADLDGLERVRLNRVWPKFSSDPALKQDAK